MMHRPGVRANASELNLLGLLAQELFPKEIVIANPLIH